MPGEFSTGLPVTATILPRTNMGKRKALNGDPRNGAAVAEDSGSEEVRKIISSNKFELY
jgi:hypothetical protein